MHDVIKQVDALILLDQVDLPGTGVVTELVKQELSSALAANPQVIALADSRQGLRDFPPMGFKMNAAELARMAGTAVVGIDAVKQHAAELAARNRQPVFVTLAEQGIVGADSTGRPEHVPAHPVRGQIDIVGAGDAVTANLAAALAAGASHEKRWSLPWPPPRSSSISSERPEPHRSHSSPTLASTTDSGKGYPACACFWPRLSSFAQLRRSPRRPPLRNRWSRNTSSRASSPKVRKPLVRPWPPNPPTRKLASSLGMIQFVRAVERMVQSFHRYGSALGRRRQHAAVRPASDPRQSRARADSLCRSARSLRAMDDDLAKAEATLAKVESADVKLPLHFGLIRLDLNGDGKAEPDERLFNLYAQLNAAARNQVNAEAAKDFVIAFDRADVAWLRGYCHLLMAMSEVYLAYDAHELFDHTAPYFYPKAANTIPVPQASARCAAAAGRDRRHPGRHRVHPSGSFSGPRARAAEVGTRAPGVDDRAEP